MAGGGGAWKVAYADFVTAMMAFFMVMWLVGQSDKVKEAIAHEFSTPPSQRNKLRMHNRKRQLPTVPEKKLPVGQPAESQEGSISRIVKGKFNPINMATLVFFADDSAELDDDARERLLRLVPWIAGKPQRIEIRGHASRRPLPPDSDFEDAWQLCYARCRATVDFLVENGIPPQRLRISQAAGYEPYTERVDPQWQARNSRVEVAMLSELTSDLNAPAPTDQPTASAPEPPHP